MTLKLYIYVMHHENSEIQNALVWFPTEGGF